MPCSVRRRVGTTTVVVTTVVFGLATPVLAHEFWLVPNAFDVAAGGVLEVRGQTSSAFPTSLSAVTVDRVAEAKSIGAFGEEPLGDLATTGPSLVIRHRPATAGQRVVAVVLKPRSVRASPASFRRYLTLEGAPEALARYEREGRLPTRDSVTRRYAKYAKTIVDVGRDGPRAFDRRAGHPLEFIPLADPATLRAGDSLAVRLIYRGRPRADARVHGGVSPVTRTALTDTAAARVRRAADVPLVSDRDGVVRIRITRTGLWNLRTLQIVPADAGSGADWDMHWATLVFQVTPRQSTVALTPTAGPGSVRSSRPTRT